MVTKFKNFLVERDTDDYPWMDIKDGMEDCLKNIKRDCGQFIKEFGDGYPIYRGQKSATFEKQSTFSRRKLLNSGNYITGLFDLNIEKMYGIENARSKNSLFCTNRFGNARSYGTPCFVFPCDGYKYVYDEGIPDYYARVRLDSLENELREFVHSPKFKLDASKIDDNIKRAAASVNLRRAVKSVLGTNSQVTFDYIKELGEDKYFKEEVDQFNLAWPIIEKWWKENTEYKISGLANYTKRMDNEIEIMFITKHYYLIPITDALTKYAKADSDTAHSLYLHMNVSEFAKKNYDAVIKDVT